MANKIRHPKKRAFLAAFAKSGNVTKAAELSNVNRLTVYDWRANDPAFVAAMEVARDEAGDRLEAECERRAVEGVDEPVFYQGCVCGTIQRYSDTLLIFLTKGAKPEKYRENIKQEIGGIGGGAVEVVFKRPANDRTD
jgi:hypothetical protein